MDLIVEIKSILDGLAGQLFSSGATNATQQLNNALEQLAPRYAQELELGLAITPIYTPARKGYGPVGTGHSDFSSIIAG